VQRQIDSVKHARRVPLSCVLLLGWLLASCGGGTTTTTEGLTGTILVHVSSDGHPIPQQPIRITRLGSKGEDVSSLETMEHTIHVAPGVFEVAVPTSGAVTGTVTGPTGTSQRVTVAAHQEVKVIISLSGKAGPHKRSSAVRHHGR
jgi:hypothetical protein